MPQHLFKTICYIELKYFSKDRHFRMCLSNVETLSFGKCISTLTGMVHVDTFVAEESNLLSFKPVLNIALEICDFSSGSSFAFSIEAMLRETSSSSISKALICLLHCSKRQWSMLGPGVNCNSHFTVDSPNICFKSARHHHRTSSSLLSVLIVGSAGDQSSLRLTDIWATLASCSWHPLLFLFQYHCPRSQ